MNKRCILIIAGISIAALFLRTSAAFPQTSPTVPTFYRDVLPVLQKHCQNCHRPGEMAFPLMTYGQAAPRARAIRESVATKKMPPWLADPDCGRFLNDPSLSQIEIKTLAMWANGGARAGDPHEGPPALRWTDGWNISPPDVVIEMPRPVVLASKGAIDYTYEIVPTHFRTCNRWRLWKRELQANLTDERGRRDTH